MARIANKDNTVKYNIKWHIMCKKDEQSLIFIVYFTEAEGRRHDDDPRSNRSGIIKLGAIRDIMDRVRSNSMILLTVTYIRANTYLSR